MLVHKCEPLEDLVHDVSDPRLGERLLSPLHALVQVVFHVFEDEEQFILCRECADAKRFEGAHKGQERRAQVSGVLGNQVVKRSIRGTGPENTPYLDTVEVAMGGAPFSPRGVSGVSGGQ